MAELKENGNIIMTDHLLIKDVESDKVLINTRGGHKNNHNQNNNENNCVKDEK